ncbi:MAG: hypothetical protein Q8908_04100 [Bacteroidota bacterium]|nr:hypothetical protein [Bacteroidota bacterium]
MHTYKFRMIVEDQDDFVRDYEIRSNQTFMDLYNIIRQTVTLRGNELASFFICDSKWRKKKEITILDMQDETMADTINDDDDEDHLKPIKKLPTFVMENSKLKDFIEDPAQRILLEYDFLNPTDFYIELFKIFDAKEDAEYPRCVKKEGELILPYNMTDHSIPNPEEEDEMLPELDEDEESNELIDDDLSSLGFNNDTKW